MIFKNVCRLCKEKGISIARLEKEAGLGNATIRGWSESSPRIGNLQAVAKVLGCTIEDLLSEKAAGEEG